MTRVLVGLDLTQWSDGWTDALPSLRRWGVEELVLAHVASVSPVPVIHRTDATRRMGWGLARAHARLGRQFSVQLSMLAGDPARELTKEAWARNADAIVLGLRKRSRIHEAFLGSTVRAVLRRTDLPVLLLPPPEVEGSRRRLSEPPSPLRVIVPTDFSGVAWAAVSCAGAVAVDAQVPVRLLHVLDAERSGGEEEANSRLSDLAGHLEDSGVEEVDWSVERGVPWERIVAAGPSGDGTLIVMGTHARGVLPELILGSQSREVVLHARSPILLIPVPDGADRLSVPRVRPGSPHAAVRGGTSRPPVPYRVTGAEASRTGHGRSSRLPLGQSLDAEEHLPLHHEVGELEEKELGRGEHESHR